MFDTVTRLFDIPKYQLENYPLGTALAGKIDGNWKTFSTHDFIENINLVSKGLLKLGLKTGDKICIVSQNRPEWNFLDLGALQVGIVVVPIYPTSSKEDFSYIMNNCEAKLIAVETDELLEKVNSVKSEVASLEHIYSFNHTDAAHFSELLKVGEDGNQDEVEAIKETIKEDDLATLIYTSGTTGRPKGVMLSHKNLVSNAKASDERFPLSRGSKALSFLPICHVFERMVCYLYMLMCTEIWYAESMDTIGDNLKEVKPHVFTTVPRLLEKVYDKIVAKGQDLTGIKKALFFWALDLGLKYDIPSRTTGLYKFKLNIARKIIFSKWQEALGGNVGIIASGSAALQPRLARVFNAAGIPVVEGYGLTETSPVIAVGMWEGENVRFGTVGKTIPGVEVKIAEDGEICVKGPNVMQGYYKLPEKTAEVIDAEGWFHTGDIGEMVEGKFLKITDRKKEIFKTSGGKYVAPQLIENKFKESRFIENVAVIGENQKFPAALVIPDFEFVKSWCKEKSINIPGSNEELIQMKEVKDRIWEEVEKYNEQFGRWERVKKVKLLAKEFSIDGGELTPTLKLKRKVILEKYKDLIEEIYS
ncbi:AMP-dependent synthetase/ligase [Luteibaculum oceani]|uniref:Long-chain fatty acid--CoA ligase n=1 Tax=Luteibaculum oceani TaxID=1294296 RepID=A0A5C6V0L3_9FLAO|nr:long-chain fatty acid--CoA ligase [Luteibaculum oceani]TXC78474.1 long-chain fatty acid--CoA ligase [Luteibaculum oceani]